LENRGIELTEYIYFEGEEELNGKETKEKEETYVTKGISYT